MATQAIAVAAELDNPIEVVQCAISLIQAEAKQLIVSYLTMPDNKPNKYKDKFYIWEHSASIIPYGDDPLATFDFLNDKPEAKATLGGLSLGSGRDYIVGLAVGPDVKNVVAACFVRLPEKEGGELTLTSPVNTFFTFESATPDTVQVQLHTLRGFRGKTWKCVVRLFEGEYAPLTLSPQVAPQLTINSDNQQNPVAFNGLSLASGYQYTVGFYTNPADDQWTTLAASVTFTVT